MVNITRAIKISSIFQNTGFDISEDNLLAPKPSEKNQTKLAVIAPTAKTKA